MLYIKDNIYISQTHITLDIVLKHAKMKKKLRFYIITYMYIINIYVKLCEFHPREIKYFCPPCCGIGTIRHVFLTTKSPPKQTICPPTRISPKILPQKLNKTPSFWCKDWFVFPLWNVWWKYGTFKSGIYPSLYFLHSCTKGYITVYEAPKWDPIFNCKWG